MLIQLPPSPIKSALDNLFPRVAPGLKWKVLRLWEHAAKSPWAAYKPLAMEQKEAVTRHINSFMCYVASQRLKIEPQVKLPVDIIWFTGDSEMLSSHVRDWLAKCMPNPIVREIQAKLGKMDLPHLIRLLRAGARTLGIPTIMIWDDAAKPAPLQPRLWTRRWAELDVRIPGLARSFASYLLTFLVTGTIEAIEQRSEETPFSALSTVMVNGAWPMGLEGDSMFYLLDIGIMNEKNL